MGRHGAGGGPGEFDGLGEDDPPVGPLDVDGVRTVAAGTAAWAVAGVGLGVGGADAEVLWTCGVGVGLGLVGVAYCVRRRDAIRRDRARAEREARATPREPLT